MKNLDARQEIKVTLSAESKLFYYHDNKRYQSTRMLYNVLKEQPVLEDIEYVEFNQELQDNSSMLELLNIEIVVFDKCPAPFDNYYIGTNGMVYNKTMTQQIEIHSRKGQTPLVRLVNSETKEREYRYLSTLMVLTFIDRDYLGKGAIHLNNQLWDVKLSNLSVKDITEDVDGVKVFNRTTTPKPLEIPKTTEKPKRDVEYYKKLLMGD